MENDNIYVRDLFGDLLMQIANQKKIIADALAANANLVMEVKRLSEALTISESKHGGC